MALGAGRHAGKLLAAVAVLLMLPVLFILMLPSLIFGGLISSGNSGQPILNDNAAIIQNTNDIAFAVNEILGEGITDAEARIAQDFAATSGDNYEIINPSSLVTRLEAVPITLQEASAYIDRYHRHNAGPKFHKFSVCLRVPGEPEPVGVAVAGIPKARHQMDGETLEINRCCTDPRYADVCSCLYARAIRIRRELGYRRFLTYTLPEESGSSLRAVGFQPDGVTKASRNGWDSPSRPRDTDRYPAGEKLRWVLYIQ